jgi:signal peptidase I
MTTDDGAPPKPSPARTETEADTETGITPVDAPDRQPAPGATEQTLLEETPAMAEPPPREAGPTHRAARPQHTRPRRTFLRELPGIVITALVISVLIKTFLVQAFYIPSGSMENTLLVNDRVLVNKLADKPDEIHRGDIVVFHDPGGWLADNPGLAGGGGGVRGAIRDALVFVGLAPAVSEEDLIKRVIGVGGDHVVGKGNKVSVNDVELAEPYVFPGDQSTEQDFDVTVPRGSLWVMGDHRSVSEDSRAHQQLPGKGLVPVEDVIGRAFTIVWPLDRSRLLRAPATFDQPGLQKSGG